MTKPMKPQKKFKKGDRVIICATGSVYFGKRGIVDSPSRRNYYLIALDGESFWVTEFHVTEIKKGKK